MLLLISLKYTTEEVVTTVDLFSLDMYSLLVFLSVHQNQIDFVSVINHTMSSNETLADFFKSYKKFDYRMELPHSKSPYRNLISNEIQSIPRHILKPCTERLRNIEKSLKILKIPLCILFVLIKLSMQLGL
jgi:hypothetical protein